MLSIIIVNYRSSADLGRCLQSIKECESKYRQFEIIVVDNNSEDLGLNKVLKKFSFVKFIQAPENGGFSYGNNIGISKAKGDVIFLLNPDTWLVDDSITKMLKRLESDKTLDLLGPQLLFSDGSNQSYFLPKSYLTVWRVFCEQFYLQRIFCKIRFFNSYFRTYMDFSKESPVEQISGAALMFRKNVLKKTGMLDEGYFMYFEETDFCLRAVKEGLNLLYYPDAKIFHSGGLTDESKSVFSTENFFKSFKRYFEKNFSKKARAAAVLFLLLGTLIRVSVFRLTGNRKLVYYSNLLKSMRSGKK